MTGLPMGHWGGERKREREKKIWGWFQNEIFTKFRMVTRKTVNTKVVRNLKVYNFMLGKFLFELWFKRYFKFPKTEI